MKTIYSKVILILLVCIGFTACSDKDDESGSTKTEWQEVKVAVVLPMEDGLDKHWKQTLGLFSDNFEKAFRNKAKGIRVNFEYYDESTSDLTALSKELSQRDDLAAVIGGQYSTDAQTMAAILQPMQKTFFTIATTEELIRAHAGSGYLWAMTETDITQCEMLLSKVVYYGGKSVALLVNDHNDYGKTITDWFAFQASELGLTIKGVYSYDEATIDKVSSEAAASSADFVICAPYEVEDIANMEEAFQQQAQENGTAPRTLYSDTAFGANVISKLGSKCEGLEGISFGSAPESGFDISYETYFGEQTALGESQVYDAAMLIGYASYLQTLNTGLDIKDALRKLVSGRNEHTGSWMAEDMRQTIDALANGETPNISGASGSLDFDSKVYTNVLQTTYYHFKIYQGKYITLDYLTTDGSKRSDATLASWNRKAEQMQDFDEGTERTYPTLDKNWALLVATSTGWSNYRHQADVLAMYQLLKKQGYTDDRIVLIMEDDIAENAKNPEKGIIQVKVGGENLYHDLKIDYKTSDLHPSDLQKILNGEKDERLTQVIGADENDNVLVFWSGHGMKGELNWGNESHGFDETLAMNVVSQMAEQKHYRKLLFLIETCYSGSVAAACEGIPGVLLITATNENETSKADVYNEKKGVWMSNRFTSTLQEQISSNPSISMRDLYYKLFINTVGSHVKVYNANNYGNIYKQTMAEFLSAQ